jgi:hypothetical protein
MVAIEPVIEEIRRDGVPSSGCGAAKRRTNRQKHPARLTFSEGIGGDRVARPPVRPQSCSHADCLRH